MNVRPLASLHQPESLQLMLGRIVKRRQTTIQHQIMEDFHRLLQLSPYRRHH